VNFKKLIKSKTFWTGVATVVSGVVFVINGQVETGVQTVAAGLAMVFLRNAIK